MAIRDVKGDVLDEIQVKNVLVSVSDKTGLEELIPAMVDANPDVRFLSSTGTYTRIGDILGPAKDDHLVAVEDYTGFPEMEGGLVKTIHPNIHAAVLAERGNLAHETYLANLCKTLEFKNSDISRVFDAKVGETYEVEVIEGVSVIYVDMVVGNLYPFESTIAQEGVTFEKARGNIDIGGPLMLRAAAKNFLSCAVVTNPKDYQKIIAGLEKNGSTNLGQRFRWSRQTFRHTGKYDTAIAGYMAKQIPNQVAAQYLQGGK